MRAIATCVGVCLLPLALLAAEENKADRLNLDGTYKIVSGEKDGKPEPKDRIEGRIVVIKGNRITGTDKDKKEFFACTFKVDTSKKPFALTMTSAAPKKGEVARGVIEQDGDTVRLCYGIPGAVSAEGVLDHQGRELLRPEEDRQMIARCQMVGKAERGNQP